MQVAEKGSTIEADEKEDDDEVAAAAAAAAAVDEAAAVAGGQQMLSPLSGAYLLVILGEPISEDHKDKMLGKLRKGTYIPVQVNVIPLLLHLLFGISHISNCQGWCTFGPAISVITMSVT